MDYQSILKIFNLEPEEPGMILLGVGLVVVLLLLLKNAIFDPFLKLIEARERSTTGAEAGAAESRHKAQTLRTEYESKVNFVRVESMKKKLATLADARAEAAKIADDAEGEAQEIVRKVRWDIASNVDQVKSSASSDVDAMVEKIVSRVKAGGEARS